MVPWARRCSWWWQRMMHLLSPQACHPAKWWSHSACRLALAQQTTRKLPMRLPRLLLLLLLLLLLPLHHLHHHQLLLLRYRERPLVCRPATWSIPPPSSPTAPQQLRRRYHQQRQTAPPSSSRAFQPQAPAEAAQPQPPSRQRELRKPPWQPQSRQSRRMCSPRPPRHPSHQEPTSPRCLLWKCAALGAVAQSRRPRPPYRDLRTRPSSRAVAAAARMRRKQRGSADLRQQVHPCRQKESAGPLLRARHCRHLQKGWADLRQ